MSSSANILATLSSRCLLSRSTSTKFEHLLQNATQGRGVVSAYCGYDPTATSLHLGNLVTVVALRHLQQAGIRPLVLVGGATGLIGDPSGKSQDRVMITEEQVQENCLGIRQSLENLLDFNGTKYGAKVVNNMDWHGNMTAINWLRDIGSKFRLSSMLSRESVKRRLENDTGISFLEFSYQIFQAYDFLHLYQKENCLFQVGGSDQWGNIVSGCDLVRKTTGDEVVGLTVPLLVSSTGEKFGKSAGNAIWLDSKMTSEYQMFQYFMNTEDVDVGRLLHCFTMIDTATIEDLMAAHTKAPHLREAQKILAREVTHLVHGSEGVEKAQRATNVLFGGSLQGIPSADLLTLAQDMPSIHLPRSLILGVSAVDLAVSAKATASKGEARRLIKGGGLYLNNNKVADPQSRVSSNDLIDGQIILLRTGKSNYKVVIVDQAHESS